MRIAFFPLVMVLVFASPAAPAADSSPNNDHSAACRADAEKFCAGVEPGRGRIARCLKKNEAQVSQPCKDVLANSKRAMKKSAPAPVPKG